jgi:addiction module RelE/StbE family toxin
MKYKIKFLEIAKKDKEAIKRYLSQFYPSTPKRFINELKHCINNLKDMPYMYQEFEYNGEYRRAVIGNYLVFYKIDDDERIVKIYRILPGMWDLAKYFENNYNNKNE